MQSTLRNKRKQFEALQKKFEALQKEVKALQKVIEDLSAAALPIVDMIAPIEPRTGPTSTLDCLRRAPSVIRPFCQTLVKMCVKHVLALMKSWWPALDIRRLRGINPVVPPEKFRELTDEVDGTANQIVGHIRF